MSLTTKLAGLNAQVRSHPGLTTAALAAAIGLVPAVSYAAQSYRGWLALGRGGVPYNIFGWAAQGLLQLIARHDVRDPAPFTRADLQPKYGPQGNVGFLDASASSSPLPRRNGSRPDVPSYVAPQRQMNEQGSAEMQGKMRVFLEEVVSANSDTVVLKTSGLEGKGTPAIFLAESVTLPPLLKRTKGEVVHIHPESSSHVVLSLADAEDAVRKGWAERHPLSGVVFPWTYVMVYAPRDEEEFAVWKRFIKASLGFIAATSSAVIKVADE